MAKTVELTDVLIWYAESHAGIHARVRTYAGDRAIHEESFDLPTADVEDAASRAGRATWDERDILTALDRDGCVSLHDPKGHTLMADLRAMDDLEQPAVAEG